MVLLLSSQSVPQSPSSEGDSLSLSSSMIACKQPMVGAQLSLVQLLPSSHVSGLPAVHVFVAKSQASSPLQTFPSSHSASDVQLGSQLLSQPSPSTKLPSSHASSS